MFTTTEISDAELTSLIECIQPIDIKCTYGYWTNNTHQVDDEELSLSFKTSIKATDNNKDIELHTIELITPDCELLELDQQQLNRLIESIKSSINIEL